MSEAPVQPRTPRQTRRRITEMEVWFRDHEDRMSPEGRTFIGLMFEYAQTEEQADYIKAALKYEHERAKRDDLETVN